MDKPAIEFVLVVYSADEQKLTIAKKIFELITDSKNSSYSVHDVATHGDLVTDKPCIVFGSSAQPYIKTTSKRWDLLDLSQLVQSDKNKRTREETFKTIPDIKREVNKLVEEQLNKKEEIKQETYIEVEGTTVGLSATDIIITESEAEYLKRIKDLLGGGKIIITKGDIRIEIEDKD